MKLAISNIAWDVEASQVAYMRMKQYGFTGLEIAPTKFFSPDPYSEDHVMGVRALKEVLAKAFGLSIVSMQSIWYGRSESIWGSDAERQALLDYTEAAAVFAEAAGCPNLVFGCPRNRNKPEGADNAAAEEFFRAAADACARHGAVLALEPNPPIYNTNFLNTTAECAAFLRKMDHPALRMNLDMGTMIENKEDVELVRENIDLINHIHVSRPGLAPVQPLALHRRLARMLHDTRYEGWVSIEMKETSLKDVCAAMETVVRSFDA